jgi:hypothetical protein
MIDSLCHLLMAVTGNAWENGYCTEGANSPPSEGCPKGGVVQGWRLRLRAC